MTWRKPDQFVRCAGVTAPGPLAYQWHVQYPWMNGWEWTRLPGETNAWLTLTNVDSFVDWSLASVEVTDAAGETVWLGPAMLYVAPLAIQIPSSGSSGSASRYPATINVFGQPTNLASVVVSLWNLSHTRSADLDILLVSPLGKKIMLMSDAGGTNGVSNAGIVFQQWYPPPPMSDAIPSGDISSFAPSNYGDQEMQLPGVPAGPYSTDLNDLIGDNPNGLWELYIYDDQQNGLGSLSGSWQLDFTFQ